MSKKMLIDASHPEETRVVVVNGTRVEELDFESRNKRQLRGNVYLARVTRVEPSLQAAFVEYGGNRHGFLAFSEIHPDYYQIPYEDRMALLEDEETDHEEEEDDEDDKETASEDMDEAGSDADDHDENLDPDDDDVSDETDSEVAAEQVQVASKRRKRMSKRRYKIQEVIKRGQILLIQAVKEERGNKGAAMTSYLSLAGRYCVLMPNTPRGGGISRKIANSSDRKRLKSIMSELEVPQGMGVIVRTAGGKRTKTEIKRDYDYLSRLWETIRETTLQSIAPALIHEEGNLVKRSIRDLYNKDIDEVLVQGDEAYKTAKDFIKMLMPSHAKNVKSYKEKIPLFLRYQVEKQIEASLDSVVQLKSGGYLVIHPTEALVSVDVNSGRSTRERNVERTALKTNLEAAEEVARQMRLRDLAGLVVIDFIDMDEHRNNRAVEKRMKDCLSQDRARVQTDRISQFGLMEISRQRRRRSLLEGSTMSCEHCEGVGRKRTVESSALVAIRAVEEIGARRQMKRIRLKVSPDVAIYIFNEKRDLLQHVDDEFDMFTELVGDDTLIRPSFIVESIENRDKEADPLAAIEEEQKREEKARSRKSQQNSRHKADKDENEAEDLEDSESASNSSAGHSTQPSESDENGEPRKKRRRRGRRGGRGKRGSENDTQNESQNEDENSSDADSDEQNSEPTNAPSKRRRPQGRRKAPARKSPETNIEATNIEETDVDDTRPTLEAASSTSETSNEKSDKPRSTARRKAPAKRSAKAKTVTDEEASKPRRKTRAKKPVDENQPVETDIQTEAVTTKDSSRRRKAPSKANSDKKSAPKTTARKAPTRKTAPKKAAKSETDSSDSENTVKTTKPARRKAPSKKPSKANSTAQTDVVQTPDSLSSDETAKPKSKAKPKTQSKAKPKPKTSTATRSRRAAPKRKASATDDSAENETEKSTPKAKAKANSEPKEKPTSQRQSRRKAPARQADPVKVVSATKTDTHSSDETHPNQTVRNTVQTEPNIQSSEAISSKAKSDEKPKKKRGWLSRLTKGD